MWGAKHVIGGTEERAAIQSVTSVWLRKRCDEGRFGDNVVRIRGDLFFFFLSHVQKGRVSDCLARSVEGTKLTKMLSSIFV
jgi:hypothetical protein